MPEKPEPKPWQEQPYDSSFKMLVADHPIILLRLFLGVKVVWAVELNEALFKQDVVKPSQRVDCAYEARNEGETETYIAHLEFETRPTKEAPPRMLEYFGSLYRKYGKPIRQALVSPFDATNVPNTPTVIKQGDEELIKHSYRVVALPDLQAQDLLDQRLVETYALLPATGGANAERLLQALSEMKEFYQEQKERFGKHLLLFDIFRGRSSTLSLEDKERIRTEMNNFDSLLDESEFVQRRKAEAEEKGIAKGIIKGIEEGKAKGIEEGRAEGLQKAVMTFIEVRFPPLAELAQQKVSQITKPERLDSLLKGVYAAPDEATVRLFLDIAA